MDPGFSSQIQLSLSPKSRRTFDCRDASCGSTQSACCEDQSSFHGSFIKNYHKAQQCYAKGDRSKPSETKPRLLDSWHRRLSRLIVAWWLWELACWLISALAICAMALLLVVHSNRRLPVRWPLGITLNEEISILAAIFKYALAVPVDEALGQLKWTWFRGDSPRRLIEFERFDNAARGPWGSLTMLWHSKAR